MQDGETVILQYSMPRVSLPPVELTRENITGFFLSTINVLGEFGTRQLFLLASQRPHLERQCSWIVRLDDPDLTGKHCATHSPPASSRPSLLSFQEIPTAWALGCKTKINFAYFDLRFSYNQQGTCLFSSN